MSKQKARSLRGPKAPVIALLFCTCLAAAPVFAQLPAWRATHPQHPGTLLLLGSIHLLRADDHPLPDIVEEIYQQSDHVIFELDLDDIAAADVQSSFMGAAMLANGTSLEDVLDPELFAQTRRQAEQLGVDIRLFSRFEPWFVATMLMSFGLSQLGYDQHFGIEQTVLAKAMRDGKEVSGIEELEAQVTVFDLLSDQDQTAFLAQTLTELQQDDETMEQLVSAWRNGALEELQDDLMQDFADFPELYERLVIRRNTAWADTLEAYSARDETSAVIVGALHLVGTDSVIEMLRERGYTVAPLR